MCLLQNCSQKNATEPHWWEIIIGSGNGFGAVWQQAITWAHVDPDLCRPMASLGHKEYA